MKKQIEHRLTAIERRLMPSPAGPEIIEIRGGFHGGDPTFAIAGALRWERAPAESFAAFRARAVAAAAASDEPFVVFGGLSD
jgi:hypothetical protein